MKKVIKKRRYSLIIAIILMFNIVFQGISVDANKLEKDTLINGDSEEVTLNKNIIESNLLKNNSFEEDLDSWSIWNGSGNLKAEIDNTDYKVGLKSMKINSIDSNTARGSIAQNFRVNDYLGKAIKLTQWIKGKNISGDMQIRAKFLDLEGYVVGDMDSKNIYVNEEDSWVFKEYIINIPDDNKIKSVTIEYIYSGIGELWIDDIFAEVIEMAESFNIIRNGTFKEDFSYWSLWKANNELEIMIDDKVYLSDGKSIKLFSKTNNYTRGSISQQIKLTENKNKSIKINQQLKSIDLLTDIEIRAKFFDEKGNQIEDTDLKHIDFNGTNDWTLKSTIINIPNNDEVDYVILDYIYSGGTGELWIDNIKAEIINKIEDSNNIKNGGFEDSLSYWGVWKDTGNFNAVLDNSIKKEGENSLKIYSNNKARGIVSQKVKINQDNKGKKFNISQWIKTDNLNGEYIQIRVKFNDENNNDIYDSKRYILGVKPTEDWKQLNYNIVLPTDITINNIDIEYVFNNFSGQIWIDEVYLEEAYGEFEENVIINGGFESTIMSQPSAWNTFYESNTLKYSFDLNDKKEGDNSFKISSSNNKNTARIQHTIDNVKSIKGKTIKLSEWIKTTTNNILTIKIKYNDDNWNTVIDDEIIKVNIDNLNAWEKYEHTIDISNNKNISKILVEYIIDNVSGDTWIDDIKMNSYVAISNISMEESYIVLKKGYIKDIKINIQPNDATYKSYNIYTKDSTIVDVRDNKLIGVNYGITSIVLENIYEKKSWEFIVIVEDEDININKEVIPLNIASGEIFEREINNINDQKVYKYNVLLQGSNTYVDINDEIKIKGYVNKGFVGKDTIAIYGKSKAGDKKVIIYELNISSNTNSKYEKEFLITLNQDEVKTGYINLDYKNSLDISINKNADNGEFTINSSGLYSYKVKKNYYGYDNVELKTVIDNIEYVVNLVIYIAPNEDILKSVINKNNGKIIVNNNKFNYVKELINKDENISVWFKQIKQDADIILSKEIVEYDKTSGNGLDLSSRDYIETLAFMYKITNEDKYAERAWSEIENICNYPDWNEDHFLDTSILSIAAAIGYDWLENYLNKEQKEIIENAIIEKALLKSKVLYDNNTGFTTLNHNWNIVCNSGMIVSSLAIAKDNNKELTFSIIKSAMKSIQLSLLDYYRDGSSYEGVGYWGFSTHYLMYLISSLNESLNIENPFYGLIDYNKIAEFPLYITGEKGGFNFGDDKLGYIESHYNLWLASITNNSKHTQYSKLAYENRKVVTIYDLLWYNTELYDKENETILDKLFNNNNIVTMRSQFENSNGTFAALKGGKVGVNHGDLDIGSFVYDALGVRWAIDLGIENYGLDGYWENDKLGKRWSYYRKRAEGHNTLVIGNSINEDQVIGTENYIIQSDLNSINPYAILDMTNAYSDKAINVTRKIQFLNGRKDLNIEDKFILKSEDTVAWQMHTNSGVEVLEDGKTLILEQQGKKLKMVILSDNDITIEVVDAIPSDNSIIQSENIGVKKIVVKTNTKEGSINVTLIPMEDINMMKEIIINGDFEYGLDGWNVWDATGNLKVESDSKNSKGGFKSVKIFNKDNEIGRGTLNQVINVSKYKGNTIYLSQWIKTNKLNGNLVARYTFMNKLGDEIGERDIKIIAKSGTKEWEEVITKIDIPKKTKTVKIDYLYDSCTGEVWIDEIYQLAIDGDINRDGVIDILDLAIIAQKYNLKEFDSMYITYDINKDEIIDIFDLVLISKLL